MAPTVRLAVLLAAIGTLGLVLPLSVVSALWFVAIVASWLDARSVRQPPTVDRHVDALSRGLPSPLVVRLLPGVSVDRATRIEIRQPQPPDIEVHPSVVVGTELNATITARRRGLFGLPDVAVRLSGPLGLGSMVHQLPEPTTVRVHPDLINAHRLAVMARRGLLPTSGRSRGPLGLGTDFDSVREYRPDDDVRQINWLATARTGRAMSTVYRQEDDRDLVIAVDSGRLTAGAFGLENSHITRLDALCDATTALALTADQVGDRSGFFAFDDEERVRFMPQRRGGRAIVESLLNLEARPALSDFALVTRRLPTLRRSVVVVATELMDEVNNAQLLASLPTLVHSHDVVIIYAADPALVVSSDKDDAWNFAVSSFLQEQHRVAVALRSAGASVVSASPQELAAIAVRAYLSRRSGRQPSQYTPNQ